MKCSQLSAIVIHSCLFTLPNNYVAFQETISPPCGECLRNMKDVTNLVQSTWSHFLCSSANHFSLFVLFNEQVLVEVERKGRGFCHTDNLFSVLAIVTF